MKYHIHTFGCQQNIADSERLAAYYEARGFTRATEPKEADVVVVNTCVVKERAENKIYGFVRNLKEDKARNPNLRIVVTGCLVGTAVRDSTGQIYKALQRRMPLVDEFLPMEEVGFEYIPVRTDTKHAWVVISNGCNNYCTYCIVPFSRGKERSRPYADIIQEVEGLTAKGCESLMLLGQNVNSYGSDIMLAAKEKGEAFVEFEGRKISPSFITHLGRLRIPTLFPQLLDRVAQIPGLKKISIMSSNPWDFSDELIDIYAKHKNIDRLLHLPVQHGDSAILKRMNRWYTREQYIELVNKLKARIPELQLTTDLIVGFPGETEEDFETLLDFLEEAELDRVGAFTYSPVNGAPANELPNAVPEEVKEERLERFMEFQAEISAAKLSRLIGKTMTVLVDEAGDGVSIARSHRDAPEIDGQVIIEGVELPIGEFVQVQITHADEHDLWGKI